ncbi:hypothetical protein B296_00055373, partial [Ensete ventricosum]
KRKIRSSRTEKRAKQQRREVRSLKDSKRTVSFTYVWESYREQSWSGESIGSHCFFFTKNRHGEGPNSSRLRLGHY